jgi:hypothetical protein
MLCETEIIYTFYKCRFFYTYASFFVQNLLNRTLHAAHLLSLPVLYLLPVSRTQIPNSAASNHPPPPPSPAAAGEACPPQPAAAAAESAAAAALPGSRAVVAASAADNHSSTASSAGTAFEAAVVQVRDSGWCNKQGNFSHCFEADLEMAYATKN